jgi:hypothetical protein
MRNIFCILAIGLSAAHARFTFSQWRGVEQYLPKDLFEVHPELGELYMPLMANLRLVSGLYTVDLKSRTNDRVSKDFCPTFAFLLKEMYPSGSGQFGWNNMESTPFKTLKAQQIGRVLKVLSSGQQNGQYALFEKIKAALEGKSDDRITDIKDRELERKCIEKIDELMKDDKKKSEVFKILTGQTYPISKEKTQNNQGNYVKNCLIF